MKEYETFKLEDNTRYILYDSVIINEKKYLLLSDIDNPANICFRREENDELITLNEEEYLNVIDKFVEKNKDLF